MSDSFSILEEKKCIYCGSHFPVFFLEQKVLKKQGFQKPDHCSLCNFKILNSFLNDKQLYHRIDDFSGNKIISLYSQDYVGKVMEANAYKKFILDAGGLSYGKEIGNDIFGDWIDLYKDFPKPSRLIYPDLENSEYASHCGWSKNLYMSYSVWVACEDIYYSFRVMDNAKDIFSSFNIVKSSNIFDSYNISTSQNIFYTNNAVASSNLFSCDYMNNCHECIFSCNGFNKKHLLFNKQYSKQEYFKIKTDLQSRTGIKKQFNFLIGEYNTFKKNNLIVPAVLINRIENVIGDKVFGSKNVRNTFVGQGLENIVNAMTAGDSEEDKNVDIINSIEFGSNCENMSGVISVGMNAYNIFFSSNVVESKNIYYCIDMQACEECMFCIGLQAKKYHILNKPYSKEEYFEKKKILIIQLKEKGKWGTHIPMDQQYFPYNDTLAYDFFKIHTLVNASGEKTVINSDAIGVITIENDDFISPAILDLGGDKKIHITWRNREVDVNISENADILKPTDESNIQNIDESILDKILICEQSARPYKILPIELAFLKKHHLPLTDIHPQLRIQKHIEAYPFGKMFYFDCPKCGNEKATIYRENTKNTYCSDCYNSLMYG